MFKGHENCSINYLAYGLVCGLVQCGEYVVLIYSSTDTVGLTCDVTHVGRTPSSDLTSSEELKVTATTCATQWHYLCWQCWSGLQCAKVRTELGSLRRTPPRAQSYVPYNHGHCASCVCVCVCPGYMNLGYILSMVSSARTNICEWEFSTRSQCPVLSLSLFLVSLPVDDLQTSQLDHGCTPNYINCSGDWANGM